MVNAVNKLKAWNEQRTTPARGTLLRMILRLLLILLGGYALIVALAFAFQNRLVYLPNVVGRDIVSTPADIGLDFEEVWLDTADKERLHAWWVPHAASRGSVLFSHGNAGNISHRLDTIRAFHALGLDVFIYDYRGYGQSSGQPSESGTYHDIEAAWRWLVQARGLDPGRIVLFGRSLGSAVAAALAVDVEAGGLIMESPFISMPELGAELYPFLPVRWLARIRYDTLERIDRVGMPVLIIHARDDEIMPPGHAIRLYAAARSPKQMLELRGDHNTAFFADFATWRDGVRAFLDRHLPVE